MPNKDKSKEQLVSESADMRQRIARLERIRNDMDAFAYTVAHDLKRPLSLILGFSELLIEDYATLSKEELLKGLETILQSGHRMNGTIDELMLLVHVRDETGLAAVPLDMNAIVSEALSRLAYVIEHWRVEVALPDRWPTVLGYAPWVEEVWCTYISETLRSNVRPLRIVLGATEQTDGNVQFWVRVDDRALTPEQRALTSQMYDSFKPDLVRRIMENLNGQFGVTAEGKLYFTLPGEHDRV